MKREAATHPKLYDLAARLDVCQAHALGLLQGVIWFCADHAIQGDLGKWPDGSISRAAGWNGDPAEFVQALVDSGWVDDHQDCPTCSCRLVLHDWPDHAEAWVKSKLARAGLDFLACYFAEGIGGGASGDSSQDSSGDCSQDSSGDCPQGQSGLESALPPGSVRTAVPNTNRTEPNRTEPNQTKPERKPRAKPPDLPDKLAASPRFLEQWDRWWAYRGRRRLTRDAATMQAQVASLAQLDPDQAADCLALSIRNGWQGVFPDRFLTDGGRNHGNTAPGRTRRPRTGERKARRHADAG